MADYTIRAEGMYELVIGDDRNRPLFTTREPQRDQQRCAPTTFPYGCNGEWALIDTSNQGATYGAQFVVFNAGNPKRATGYFKNVSGQVRDTFTITHD